MPPAACCSETSFSGGTTGISAACLMDAEGVRPESELGGSWEGGLFDGAQTVSGSADGFIAPPGAAVWRSDSRE
jgi:hypothetical protein